MTSVVNKHQIHPALINKFLKNYIKINLFYINITIYTEWEFLKNYIKINLFYINITIYTEWEDLNEQSDPVLWKPLTGKNAKK